MTYEYDDQNVFAKILRNEIPNSTILSTEFSLAFKDVAPQVPEHILVIPRGPYVCFDHFVMYASYNEIIDFNKVVAKICVSLGLSPCNGGNGYRLISNSGRFEVQEVPHYHLRILGGQPLGRMLQRPTS